MAGTIKHSWNGTVLTITSDSGTSSADLKGEKGDRGIRGAQGVRGLCHRHGRCIVCIHLLSSLLETESSIN